MPKTIPQLTDATTVNAADELIVHQGGVTKRATAGELAKGLNEINGTINVRDFGAVGDGVTDDTAAIQAAFNSHNSVYVPAGTYILTSKVVCTNKRLTVHGSGANESTLKWTAANGGIEVVNTTLNENLYQFSNLQLVTTQANGGTALSIDVATNIPEPSIRISNVNIRGDNKTTDYWTVGINSNNGVVSYYENIYISGQEGVANASTKGIVLGQDAGAGAMVVFMNQIDIKFCDIGLHATMSGSLGIEGLTMLGSIIVQCNQCVVVDASAASYRPPYFAFTSCQFDAVTEECVKLINLAQVFMSDCVFYGENTASSSALVSLENCLDFSITHSYFIDFATLKQRKGIHCVSSTSAGHIGPCMFGNLDTGILLDSGTSNVRVTPQQIFSTCTTNFTNAGTGNTLPNSWSVYTSAGSSRIDLSAGDGAIEITRAGGGGYIDFKSLTSEDADARIEQFDSGLSFFTGGNGTMSRRMTIVDNGNTGVGTQTPSSKLHVDGDITVSSATTTGSAGSLVGYLVVNINGTSRKIPYHAT